MNKNELVTLMGEIAAVDNRRLDEAVYKAWFEIIQNIPMDIAREALHKCRADDRIGYLEPKHIVAAAKEIAQAEVRYQKPPEVERGVPQPKCKHEVPVTECRPCCRKLKDYHNQHGDRGLLSFARKEIWND